MYGNIFTLIKLGYVLEAKDYKSTQESLQMLYSANTNQNEEIEQVRRKSSEYKTSDTEMI